ncbi:MAG: trypsin-like peptidase domain-containing protein [Actinomycetota bacterium]
MGRVRLGRRAIVTFAAAAVALSSGITSAQAAPTAAQRGVVLATPGVVFIATDVTVSIKLSYGDLLGGPNKVITRKYSFPYSSGSGFVVSPDGTIVTASHVVQPDSNEVKNYAVNTLFSDIFDYPVDNLFVRYNAPDRFVRNIQDQCYRQERCEFKINAKSNVLTAISIAGQQLATGEEARVLTSTGAGKTDVAVLDINGTNLPTVPLADSVGELSTGDEVTGLGFPGSNQGLNEGITEPTNIFGRVSNIRTEGTSQLVEVDADLEPGMSGGPVLDQQGRVIGLTSFTLLQSSGESGPEYLRTVDDIKAAMASAGVSASRGPLDNAFASAMNLFWGSHFSAAVPEFQKALALSDSHPLAKEYLAQAQAKAGTPADIPVEEPGSFPIALVGGAAGGVLVLALALWLVMRSRRKPAAAPAAPAATAAPMAATPVAPVEMAPEAAPATTPNGPESHPVGFQGPAPEPAGVGAPAPGAPEGTAPMAAPEQAAPAPEAAAPASVQAEAAPQFKYCTNCGTGNEMDAHFCRKCGHQLN